MAKEKETTSSKSQQKAENDNNDKPKSYGTEPFNFEREIKPVTIIDGSIKEKK